MEIRSHPSVLWREGMFLCPQHLQAVRRELATRIRVGESIGLAGSFGLLRMRIDEEALGRDVFSVLVASLILPDGSFVDIPTTAAVEQREFSKLFTGPELYVYLGVLAVQPNVPQVAMGSEGHGRYRMRTESVFDENLRDSSKEIEFRIPQARVFFGDEDRTGFDCLPIAKLVRRGKPVLKTVPSASYIPPILAIGASAVLVKDLRELAEILRSQARDLAPRIPATAGLASAQRGADISGFVKLQAINQSVAVVDQLSTQFDLHPFEVYRGLCTVVGNLAIFGASRVVPEFPPFDPMQPEEGFAAVLRLIRELVGADVPPPYEVELFKEARPGTFECKLPDAWVEKQRVPYLAIETGQSVEAVIRAVEEGWFKIGAPVDLDRMMRMTTPIVQLAHERVPPLAFPKREALHYFRIVTEGSSRDGWLSVLKARTILLAEFSAWEKVKFSLYIEVRD